MLNPRNVSRADYVQFFTKWVTDREQDQRLLDDLRSGHCLSGVYNGTSGRIRRLVKLAYLRGVMYGVGLVWEAHQGVSLRDAEHIEE